MHAADGFTQLTSFNAEQVETFDWAPDADKVAVACGNSISVFDGHCFDEASQVYSDVFELENADGKCSAAQYFFLFCLF